MTLPPEPHPAVDLTAARAAAEAVARVWRLPLGRPFAMANVSYVVAAGDAVLKVPWDGDDESLHEADALQLWDGDGAVRLLRRSGRALLLQRAVPGTDLSGLPEREAVDEAVALALRLWRPAVPPFRPVVPAVRTWIQYAAGAGSELAALARELLRELNPSADWVVHGDFHHHNVILRGDEYVAIDPKPYAAEREYDVVPFLWNPVGSRMDDLGLIEQRIAAFAAAGLDEFRIRAWTVIRGSYLLPHRSSQIRRLLPGR